MSGLQRLRPPEWTREGSCVGMAGSSMDPWHPDDELTTAQVAGQYAIARRICADCPVRLLCAVYALENGISEGVWGGLTPGERRQLAKRRGFPIPGAAVHGTRSRYVAGCHAGPGGRACEDCLRAHRDYERHQRAVRRDRALALQRAEPPYLTSPVGRGRWRAIPGQYLLITDRMIGAAA